MIAPAIPADENSRVETLHALNILDTPPEERFDRLTRLAKRVFGVPMAIVSLIDENRQWSKSIAGTPPPNEIPRPLSFCGHAILSKDIMVVPNTTEDIRFYDNPLVTGDAGIRFYAGYPLVAPNGSVLGTLCLLDVKPKILDEDERSLFRDLAHIVEQEIVTIQQATMDELTKLSNRRGFEVLANHALQVAKRMNIPAALLFFDLNDFKQINDTFGHAEGDHALRIFSEELRRNSRGSDVVGRLGGDEFVAFLTDSTSTDASVYIQRLEDALDKCNSDSNRGYLISYSVGYVEYDRTRHLSIASMLSEADVAMYSDKQSRKASRNLKN